MLRDLIQILLLDIVFSLDSVITAVGMANDIAIMVIAMVHRGAGDAGLRRPVSDFVEPAPERQDPGAVLPAPDRRDAGGRGLGQHIDKGYIYFAMAFSLLVELLNMRYRRKQGEAAPPRGRKKR